MIQLTKSAETSTTITLSWSPVPGAIGYRFSAENQPKFSHTFDASRTSVKFAKGSSWYLVEALGLEDSGRYPQAPPTGKPLTGTITSGGTYTGPFSGNVSIQTQQPVVLDRCSGAPVITGTEGVDLEIRRCTGVYADGWDSPRWLTLGNWRRLIVEANAITNSRGMELWPNGNPNPTTVITRNRHLNPKGDGKTPVGNFVQLREIWGSPKWGPPVNPNPGTIVISWNEIVGVHNHSNAEDTISIFKTAHVRCHQNLIDGQTKPDSFSSSSQNSITVDGDDEPELNFDVLVEDNVVVDAYAVYIDGGTDCALRRNLVVSDGKYGDTGQAMRFGYSGVAINRRAIRCVAEGNRAGYVGSQGRVDFQQDAGVWTGNVSLPGPITRQTELDAVNEWRARAAAAGISIGP